MQHVKPNYQADFKVDNSKIAEAISLLTAVYNSPDEKTFTKARTLIENAARAKTMVVPIRADQIQEQKFTHYESDTPWLDEWFGGGPRRQEVILIGGIPYIGKTHFAIWLTARYPGAKIAYLHGEDLSGDMKKFYKRAGGKALMKNVWLANVLDYAFTVQTAEHVVNLLAREGNKPDIVVFDNLDIMRSSLFTRSDWEDATGVIREVKVFAGRNDVIAIALSQLHEKSSERKGMGRFYRAKISKMAGADIIIMVDDVQGTEYRMKRTKAKGRDLSADTEDKILDVDWKRMIVEDIT